MKINDAGIVIEAAAMDSEAHSGPFQNPPTLLVMHYTASGGDALTDARYFASRTKKQASAHLILGRGGLLFQSVSLLNIAHHAGRSMWRGKTGCNKFSIGIEIDNWGPLDRGADGEYRAWPGTIVPEMIVFEGRHKNGGDHDSWERYPETQLAALDEVTECILETYPTIHDIVGHDDIAPERKQDPGPAFPLKRYTDLLSSLGDDVATTWEVWASSLNVRAEPARGAALLDFGPLPKGTIVDVLVDAGDWSYIEVASIRDGETGIYQGWVFDKYLR